MSGYNINKVRNDFPILSREVYGKPLVYLDNAATTQVYREVVETMLPFFGEVYGNPASSYRFGNRAKDAVEKARRTLSGGIGARPEEIYFTR